MKPRQQFTEEQLREIWQRRVSERTCEEQEALDIWLVGRIDWCEAILYGSMVLSGLLMLGVLVYEWIL